VYVFVCDQNQENHVNTESFSFQTSKVMVGN